MKRNDIKLPSIRWNGKYFYLINIFINSRTSSKHSHEHLVFPEKSVLSSPNKKMGKSIYFYDPSLTASIIFTILYLLSFIYHLYLSVIAPFTGKFSRAGYFIPVTIGAAVEVGAYALRAASVKKPDNIGLYAISSTLIVIAPVLVCASLYILIGRLIQSTEKEPLLLFGNFELSHPSLGEWNCVFK